jgi:hypothetical protein
VDLSVSRSRNDGWDELCVTDARTGRELGRYDRRSGRLAVLDEARVHEMVQALWDFLADAVGPGAPGVSGICETVVASEVPEVSEAPGDEDGDGGDRPEPRVPAAAPAGGVKGKGGRVVDRGLGRLRRDGWTVLSPGGRRSGAGFDHLVIGPPGVFAITVKHGGDVPSLSHGRSRGAGGGVAGGRHDAESAARMLSAASGMAVKVTPMLAFIGAGADAVEAYTRHGRGGSPGDILVARGEDIAEVLWGFPAVYSLQERQRIFDIARGADLWRAA